MILFKSVWVLINFFTIIIILIRSPSEQSLQEILAPWQIFNSSGSAETNLDKIIFLLIFLFLSFGLIYSTNLIY
ncbi:unnamed protein product [Chrysoparadoxa australica]